MTRYAVDDARGELIATWGAGHGDVAITVAKLPGGAAGRQAMALSAELSGLSEELWHCYTHPASAADSVEVNTEGWRRQETRNGFAEVVATIRRPKFPYDNGSLIVSYDPVAERSHRVGRALHAFSDAELTAAVVSDVETELKAVEQAELGELSDRAVEAVLLTREDASPVQVAAADRILAGNPLGGDELFLRLDPTAASVAAAHWLQAAADVVSGMSGLPVTQVVAESDNIEALPHTTPTAVLELMQLGLTPRAAVTSLIRGAMAIAEGEVPDVDELTEKIEEAEELAERYASDDPAAHAEIMKIRLTPLNPRRPARDLLEDLLTGIWGCRLLYVTYADHPDTEPADKGAEADDALEEAFDTAFCNEVRARAAAGP